LITRLEASLGEPPTRATDILNAVELRLAMACAELKDWQGVSRWRDHACRRRPGLDRWFDSRPELAPAFRASRGQVSRA
jgi:hypothetical protein